MPIKNPPHPGDFIRTEIIEPAGLSVTAAAERFRFPALPCPVCSMARRTCLAIRRYALKRLSASRWTRLCGCSPPTTSRGPASAKRRFAWGVFTAQPVFTHDSASCTLNQDSVVGIVNSDAHSLVAVSMPHPKRTVR